MRKFLLRAFIALSLMAALSLLGVYLVLRASLPINRGRLSLDQLKQQVIVERDQLGIPTLQAGNREDLAQALGFLHAQERFFQMDLLRRASSGELSELFGRIALDFDKKRRLHALRRVVKQMWLGLTHEEQGILFAYSRGVNQGLAHLQAKPFEYFLLATSPVPWKPEDSLLVGLNLFFELQDGEGEGDLMRGYLHQLLPLPVRHFFLNNGSPWEAALDGSQVNYLPIPFPEDFSYLSSFDNEPTKEILIQAEPPSLGGSNQWAVNGKWTKDGKAILACDMHLNLSVPNIWYRARFLSLDAKPFDVCGLTLPGMPLMVCGSNGYIAWGFTNAYIDTADIAIVTVHSENKEHYLTGEGWIPFTKRYEKILIKGENPEIIEFSDTQWGPLLDKRFFDQPIALRWIAHDPECFNLKLIALEKASSLDEALTLIPQIRIPILNCMLADHAGNIGWTLIGALPKRTGFDGNLPILLKEQIYPFERLDPKSYPKVINPEQGILWTANNRTINIAENPIMTSSQFLNGIRAYQIQHRLNELSDFTLQNMLLIQLDDEAFFFQRWHKLLMQVLQNTSHLEGRRKELLKVINHWNGHASVESAAYYWIRLFREHVYNHILKRLLKPCFLAYPSFNPYYFDFEEPVWLIVSQQPSYLVNSKYGSWQKELLSLVDKMIDTIPLDQALDKQTWGKRNTMAISHPLSEAIPGAKLFLDMKPDSISGDYWVPRVISPKEGASQRLVIAPGDEKKGILHTPCGQSGHPLSSHYRDSHPDWVEGRPTSFQPGSAQETLILLPASS